MTSCSFMQICKMHTEYLKYGIVSPMHLSSNIENVHSALVYVVIVTTYEFPIYFHIYFVVFLHFLKCGSGFDSSIESFTLCIHHFKLKQILFIARSQQSAVCFLKLPNSMLVMNSKFLLFSFMCLHVARNRYMFEFNICGKVPISYFRQLSMLFLIANDTNVYEYESAFSSHSIFDILTFIAYKSNRNHQLVYIVANKSIFHRHRYILMQMWKVFKQYHHKNQASEWTFTVHVPYVRSTFIKNE